MNSMSSSELDNQGKDQSNIRISQLQEERKKATPKTPEYRPGDEWKALGYPGAVGDEVFQKM